MGSLVFSALCASGLLIPHVFAQNASNSSYDILQHVDPLIGSSNGGNVFAGATIPFGMAKAGADTDSEVNQAGFAPDGSNVTGFSMLHDSGTGGQPSLGNFALFPYAGCGDSLNDSDACTFPKYVRKRHYVNESVKATPGFFGIRLDNEIGVDMTTTQHAALFRFSFPPQDSTGKASTPLILLDLTDLSDTRQDNGTISIDPRSGRMTGSARFRPSFGSGTFVSYFCADFKGPSLLHNGIFVANRSSTAVKDLTIARSINDFPVPGGAFNRFSSPGSDPILVRMATSFISSEQACGHVESEIPNYDFNATQTAAVTAWREKLAPISISSGGGLNQTFLTNFYSGFYRTFVNPQNYTGENPLWKSNEPYWDSFYCIWDLFRSQMPFMTIVDPAAVSSQIRSLLDTYRNLGWLPDCRMSLCKGFTQGGSNADNVLADAYQKGIEGIDWNTAYEAMVKDAEVEPFDRSNEGRGGLDSWKSLGYIPVQDFDYKGYGPQTRSVSRTLEYAYNDFVISELARALGGRQADVEKYRDRSANWQNLLKGDAISLLNGTNTGFLGFFQPKNVNGTWAFQDPLKCSNIDVNPDEICSLQGNAAETFESSLWEYGFFVPHDQATLIGTIGGPDSYVRRLNYLHDQNITYIGNEPAFLTVYQYHYAGRPALSAKRAHFYIPDFFDPSPSGLPGNDDSGTMGAFVAFSMMGLFPNPGQNVYFIIPPFFESISIKSPATGKNATIRNVNFDPTYQNIYIQNATLNGQPYTKNWLDHSFFTEGKELVLTLGKNESSWGTKVEDLPPSVGQYSTSNSSIKYGRTHTRSRRTMLGFDNFPAAPAEPNLVTL